MICKTLTKVDANSRTINFNHNLSTQIDTLWTNFIDAPSFLDSFNTCVISQDWKFDKDYSGDARANPRNKCLSDWMTKDFPRVVKLMTTDTPLKALDITMETEDNYTIMKLKLFMFVHEPFKFLNIYTRVYWSMNDLKNCAMCISGKKQVWCKESKEIVTVSCPNCNFPQCVECSNDSKLILNCSTCAGYKCLSCKDTQIFLPGDKSNEFISIPCSNCVCNKCWGSKYLTTSTNVTFPCNLCNKKY